MSAAPVARTFTCGRCGSHFQGHPLAPDASCPHCGARGAVDPRAYGELANHAARVGADLSRVDQALGHIHDLRTWTNPALQSSSNSAMYLMTALGGGPVVVVLGAALVQKLYAGSIAPMVVVQVGFGIFTAVLLGAVCYRAATHRARKAARAVLPASAVACRVCGAGSALDPRDPLARCRYCGAAVVAPRPVMKQVAESAAYLAWRAELENLRERRRWTCKPDEIDVTTLTGVGGLGFTAVVAAVPVLAYFLPEASARTSAPVAAVSGAVSLLCVAGAAAWLLAQRRANERRAAAYAALTTALGGARVAGVLDAIAWLDAYWPVEYPTGRLLFGSSFGAVTLDARPLGYPLLVLMDPRAAQAGGAGGPAQAKVQLFLAGSSPRPLEPRALAALGAELAPFGFGLQVTPAGLVAEAGLQVVASVRSNPESCLALADVARHLVRRASELGLRPTEPIP